MRRKRHVYSQTVYNEGIWFPSHGDYKSPQLSIRILDYKLFMNTKYLFKMLRPNKAEYDNSDPVSVHVNYHAVRRPRCLYRWKICTYTDLRARLRPEQDKWDRMKAIIKRYRNKDMKALDSFTVKS